MAVLHDEVSLSALHEIFFELSGRRVSVGVGVLLEAVLAELGALTVALEAVAVLVDCQGLRWRCLFDDALLVPGSRLAKSWPRHDILLVSCLDLHTAASRNQAHPLISRYRPTKRCYRHPLCQLSLLLFPLPIRYLRVPLPKAASLV